MPARASASLRRDSGHWRVMPGRKHAEAGVQLHAGYHRSTGGASAWARDTRAGLGAARCEGTGRRAATRMFRGSSES
jgi:hypothetical protein